MGKTSIEWTDFSVNPIRARFEDRVGHYCEKISAGCANCYSSRIQARFGMPAYAKTKNNPYVKTWFDPHKLHQVRGRRKPTKFFWCDMTDMFGRWVPDGWIDECFRTMAATPQHVHQILTKRADRMNMYISSLPDIWPGNIRPGWPLPNVWLSVSVENQATWDERIPLLLRTPAAVRFVSLEPMLGLVDFGLSLGEERHISCESCKATPVTGKPYCPGNHEAGGIDWVICGGESGPKARPMHPDWARSVRDQCQAAGVPFFFKQWGEWRPITIDNRHGGTKGPLPIKRTCWVNTDGTWVLQDEATYDLYGKDFCWGMVRVGKKSSGCLLDGREWKEFPEVKA
jgi:protein gp37